MKKWRKKIGLAFVAMGLLAIVPNAEATEYGPVGYCECIPCDCWGIDVFGDFIYWKPCIDEVDYAAQVTDISGIDEGEGYTQNIKYKCLSPDWEPGFRVGLAINDVWCEWRLSGSYTYIKCCDSSNIIAEEGTVVLSPLQFAGLTNPVNEEGEGGFYEVEGKCDIKYQSWDFLISRALCSSECYSIAPFVGVEGLILDQKIKTESKLKPLVDKQPSGTTTEASTVVKEVTLVNGFGSTDWNSEFCAYGLKFGTDYTYQVGDCLKFFSRGSFTIASGENDGKNEQSLTMNYDSKTESPKTKKVNVEEDDCCIFVNGYNIQLGLLYESDMCGYDFAFRFGYEFVKWHNVPKPRRFPSKDESNESAYTRAISTAPNNSTIGFHGLMVGLAFGF